ncbi:hypothetical protein [Nitrosomonas sp. Is37]|uniref:hypothetical protein n=1 Tax=Nitrosomonas sp. Is37 TaxID=3080535 RepID=UPI00294AD4DA|nr:hypothetical protein [Nitrosomonas sp. Is37]MDV6345409.1 hypothetical protein [Nitrosomonas sp. Is37]
MVTLDDLAKDGERWNQMVADEFGLDPNDLVHEAAAYVLIHKKHLFELGKKTTADKYKKELDKLTKQALQLLETVRSLPRGYKDCLPISMFHQYGVKIVSEKYGVNTISNDQLYYCIESLANAAQSVKKVKLEPIKNGYYNGFLFEFINNLVGSIFEIGFYSRANHTKGDSTEAELESLMLDFWNKYYSERVRKTAIQVIQKTLCGSKNRHAAQKAVKDYLAGIVSERIRNKARNLLDDYNKFKSKELYGNN